MIQTWHLLRIWLGYCLQTLVCYSYHLTWHLPFARFRQFEHIMLLLTVDSTLRNNLATVLCCFYSSVYGTKLNLENQSQTMRGNCTPRLGDRTRPSWPHGANIDTLHLCKHSSPTPRTSLKHLLILLIPIGHHNYPGSISGGVGNLQYRHSTKGNLHLHRISVWPWNWALT